MANSVLVEIIQSRGLTTVSYVVTIEANGVTTMHTFFSEESAMRYAEEAAKVVGARLTVVRHNYNKDPKEDINRGGGALDM